MVCCGVVCWVGLGWVVSGVGIVTKNTQIQKTGFCDLQFIFVLGQPAPKQHFALHSH